MAGAGVVACLAALATPLPAAPAVVGPDRARPPACSRGLVALTFDDGPSSSVTPGLLRLLEREQVPATFFMVGTRIATAPAVARSAARHGFTIGNHTWIHTDLTTQSEAEIRDALGRTRRLMQREHLHPTWLMRPPYGAIDARVRGIVESMGYTPVLWTVDSRDWTGLSAAQIEAGIVGAVRPHATNIVLQHDGVTNSPASIAAVPGVISTLRARGYCFADLDDRGRPTPPVPVATLTADRRVVEEGDRIALTVTLDRPTSRPTAAEVEVARTSGASGRQVRRVRFAVGQQVAHLSVPSPHDRVDTHGREVTAHLTTGDGVTPARGRVRVAIHDDEAPPTASLHPVTVQASATGPVPAPVPVVLDRRSDLPVRVVARSALGRAVVVIAAGQRRGVLELTVPVGSPEDPVQTIDVTVVRVVHGSPGPGAVLTVEPPAVVDPPAT